MLGFHPFGTWLLWDPGLNRVTFSALLGERGLLPAVPARRGVLPKGHIPPTTRNFGKTGYSARKTSAKGQEPQATTERGVAEVAAHLTSRLSPDFSVFFPYWKCLCFQCRTDRAMLCLVLIFLESWLEAGLRVRYGRLGQAGERCAGVWRC